MPIIGFFSLNALLLEEAAQAHRKVCSEHSPVSCNQSAVGSACPHSVSTGLPQWWSRWDPFPSAAWWHRKGRTEVRQHTPAEGRDNHEVKQKEQRWEHNLHSISVTAMGLPSPTTRDRCISGNQSIPYSLGIEVTLHFYRVQPALSRVLGQRCPGNIWVIRDL